MSTPSWSIGDATYRSALLRVLRQATGLPTADAGDVAASGTDNIPAKGTDPIQADMQLALMLAERMARRTGNSNQITKDEFLAEVGDALTALREGRFHYLNDLAMHDVPRMARTLVAMRNLAHGMTSRLDKNFEEMKAPSKDVDFSTWDDFLQSFGIREVKGWERLAAGAVQFVEVSETTAREVSPVFGAVLLGAGVVAGIPGLGFLNSGLEYVAEGSAIWGSILSTLGFSLSSVGGLLGLVGGGGILMRSRPNLADPGESADIRFHELLKRAVTVMRGVPKRSSNEHDLPRYRGGLARPNTARSARYIQTLEFKGLITPPADYDDVLDSADAIGAILEQGKTDHEVLALYESDDVFKTHVQNLLLYLMHFGDVAVKRDVAEARLLLHSGRYQLRADKPLGKPTANFPHRLDGTDCAQVMDFLKNCLHIEFASELDETVWKLWQEAWNQNIVGVQDIRWDLDETIYEYVMKVGHLLTTGRETIFLRSEIITCIALALKHQISCPFASFTMASRIADFMNDPRLAAIRFAFTLRMPQDPDVRLEEVMSMGSNTTFKTIADRCAELLHRFADSKPEPKETDWDSPATRLLAYVARKLTKSIFIRGIKDHAVIENHGDDQGPVMLVDNSVANNRVYSLSGGRGAVQVPTHAPVMGQGTTYVRNDPTVLAVAKTVKESEVRLRPMDARSEKFPEPIVLDHGTMRVWALKNLSGFLLPLLNVVGSFLRAANIFRRWSKAARGEFTSLLGRSFDEGESALAANGDAAPKQGESGSAHDQPAGETHAVDTADDAGPTEAEPNTDATAGDERSPGAAAHGVTAAGDIHVDVKGVPADRASPAAPPATKPNGNDGPASGSTGSSGPVAQVVPLFRGSGEEAVVRGGGLDVGDRINMGPQLVVHGANVMVVMPEVIVHEAPEPVRHLRLVKAESTVDSRQPTEDENQLPVDGLLLSEDNGIISPDVSGIAPHAVYGNVVPIRAARSLIVRAGL